MTALRAAVESDKWIVTEAGDRDNAKKGARISRYKESMGRGARSYTVRKQHKNNVNQGARNYRYNTRNTGDEMSEPVGPGSGPKPGRFGGSGVGLPGQIHP